MGHRKRRDRAICGRGRGKAKHRICQRYIYLQFSWFAGGVRRCLQEILRADHERVRSRRKEWTGRRSAKRIGGALSQPEQKLKQANNFYSCDLLARYCYSQLDPGLASLALFFCKTALRLAAVVVPGVEDPHGVAVKPELAIMLFLVVSTPGPERPSELAKSRQSFWPWMARYEAQGVCRQVYARVGRGAVAILDVENNDALHRIL